MPSLDTWLGGFVGGITAGLIGAAVWLLKSLYWRREAVNQLRAQMHVFLDLPDTTPRGEMLKDPKYDTRTRTILERWFNDEAQQLWSQASLGKKVTTASERATCLAGIIQAPKVYLK